MVTQSACFEIVKGVIGARMTDDEIRTAFDRVDRARKTIIAETGFDRFNERLQETIAAEAEQTKILAAIQRRNAARNIIVRDRLDGLIQSHVDAFKGQGGWIGFGKMKNPYVKAVLSLFEGTHRYVESGRLSADTLIKAYENRFVGDMLAELTREVPHMQALKIDRRMLTDIEREIWAPDSTGNADAAKAALIFSKHMEASRLEMNRLGAVIGKIDGYAPQNHDDIKILAAGEETWVGWLYDAATGQSRLNLARSFPELQTPAEIREALQQVYLNIVTGEDRMLTAAQKGEFRSPANLAKMLGRNRILHFATAEDSIAYREAFGHGTLIDAITQHQFHSGRLAGQMEMFGPNPEVMVSAIVESLAKRARSDPSLTAAERASEIASLSMDSRRMRGNRIADAFLEMQGFTRSSPVARKNWANLTGSSRAVLNAARMGGAVITALPTDSMMAGLSATLRGTSFFRGISSQLGGFMRGRPKAERAEMAYLLGEGYDGLIRNWTRAWMVGENRVGVASRLAESTFRWSGFMWQQDIARAAAADVIAAEIGMHSGKTLAQLKPRYRLALSTHSIGEDEWNVIRDGVFRNHNGNLYVTPDRIRDVADGAFGPIVNRRLDALPANKRTAAIRDRYLADAKRDVEMTLRRYIADEVNYGVIEEDAAARRLILRGTDRGSYAGEALRYVMQWKGFPLAFSSRVVPRFWFAMTRPGQDLGERLLSIAHIGTLLAGMTMAGYMSIAMKDVLKGNWPPRDPLDPKVLNAAFLQGGAAGIYGDFLFGMHTRFGQTPIETAAGPVAGSVSQFITALQNTMMGDPKAAQWVNLALQNTPYINMWYARAALDYLFLNAMREASSPGYLRRQRERLRRELGQERFIPQTAF